MELGLSRSGFGDVPEKGAQKSLAPRTSWCGSRCGVGRGQDLVVRMSIYCRDTLGVESSSIYLSVPVHIENLDPAAGGLRQLDPTAFSVCAVLENAPSARLSTFRHCYNLVIVKKRRRRIF